MCLLHRLCIFQLYLEFMWRNSIFLVKSLLIYDSRSILKCSHGTFVTFIQENGVPRGKLQLLGFFHYNFWHKMSTLNEISSCIGTPRGLVLVYSTLQVYQRSNTQVRHIPPKCPTNLSQHSLSPTIWSDIMVGRESGYFYLAPYSRQER